MTLESTIKVLIADDEIEKAQASIGDVSKLQSEYKFDIDYVTTSKEAIEKAKTGNYQLIISDLNMDKMYVGLEVLTQIKDVKAKKYLWTSMSPNSDMFDDEKNLGELVKSLDAEYIPKMMSLRRVLEKYKKE